jgi:glycosyltransferase involved in cell wall biosynthesis/peptidoglycan/xylan/chitin deacetylase (PgdA/CDA1 family)
MMINKVYYFLKPILPWQLRLALRRVRAHYQRQKYADAWPIDEGAGVAPHGWPGWPAGKRFAFVLTHDVEGSKGLARVQRVATLESQYGFRSSFNFVPEEEYQLSEALRQILDQGGFEVGVHGLKHDGKLYKSKASFLASAARIKGYLQQWNAKGFRSPLMQHRLDWLHVLGVDYDSSTFDTDPFEPESDGFGTIFPFWVPHSTGGGYVELPYTLVQDFNLFKVLGESNINVWKQKLDWIAERGGMALINTHPDYMCFGDDEAKDEYPVSLYSEFLCYVREKYDGSYWAALPKDVARYYRDAVPEPTRNTRKKVCMLAYAHYEYDNRIRRYAETLAKRGDRVDVIAHGVTSSDQPEKHINGVNIYCVQNRRFNEQSKWTYALRSLRFLATASLRLTRLHARNRYDVIHIHNMPDFLVFAAWYPKLTGAKLILDIHDLVPEFFQSKFSTRSKRLYGGVLKSIERMASRYVDHVIVSNHLWQKTLIARSVEKPNCSVVLNSVDPYLFMPKIRTRNDGKFIVLFPGSFQWHQGLDVAIEAFSHFRRRIPNSEFHLYGGGNHKVGGQLKELVQTLNLQGVVKFCGSIQLDQVADVIANADLGVVPKRADSFGNEAYSTKIMEFMSQGVPVVVSKTKIDTFYFEEGLVHFFPSGDSVAMAQAMYDVVANTQLRESLIRRGHEYVACHGWKTNQKEYLDLIDSLATEPFDDAQLAPLFRAACDAR